ncbi:MAG TPA: hypothetical protein VEP90_28360 [Methylomirabilota bacterium]|nr:hypothetical protein [Methylomirabilota bacterium]
MKVKGPYQVQHEGDTYEIVYVEPQPVKKLLPPKVYTRKQSAYYAASQLNRKWQQQQKGQDS